MAELNLQAIKDRVARGRLQGGNPTGGEDGPFHLYHLALDDLDALIAYVEDVPPSQSIDEFASVETLQSPRVAEISDEERANLLKVAEEHAE